MPPTNMTTIVLSACVCGGGGGRGGGGGVVCGFVCVDYVSHIYLYDIHNLYAVCVKCAYVLIPFLP